jgi:REP element-mobilizing transposase RayT
VIKEVRRFEAGKSIGKRRTSKKIEEYLDKSAGSCCLREQKLANVVAEALRRFDGIRYALLAWCIMPNHVHVVFQSAPGHPLRSFTAGEINRRLARKGVLWQLEYYDHLIRDGEQLRWAVCYTVENPRKAALGDWPYVYVSAAVFGGPEKLDVLNSRASLRE